MVDGLEWAAPLEEYHRDRLRSLAWFLRASRSCSFGGVDRITPLVDYGEELLRSGYDRREVVRELLCAIRCCGECAG